MKETIVKCNCDYCCADMTDYEYNVATKITIRVDVPNQKGGCGECNGLSMSICNKCSEELGIVNYEIHNGQMNSRSRILRSIEKAKLKIINMFFTSKK